MPPVPVPASEVRRSFPFPFPLPSQPRSESGCEYASERTAARVAAELSTGEGSEAVVVLGRRSRAQERRAEHAKEERAVEVHPCQVGAVVAAQQQTSAAHGPPVPHRIRTLILLDRPPLAMVVRQEVVRVD